MAVALQAVHPTERQHDVYWSRGGLYKGIRDFVADQVVIVIEERGERNKQSRDRLNAVADLVGV